MPRATVTLITPRPGAPQSLPEAALLRQFGIEIAEEASKPAAASTRRSLLAGLGGVFAGAALEIAAPSAAQSDPSYCRDAWEVAALLAFRDLNPHQQEAALAFLHSWTSKARELSVGAIVDHPDATLIVACKRFAHLDKEYGRLCQLTDWPMEHVLTPAEQALQNEFDGVSDEQDELGAWLAGQVPQTAAGLQAKAQAVMAYGFGPFDSRHDRAPDAVPGAGRGREARRMSAAPAYRLGRHPRRTDHPALLNTGRHRGAHFRL